MIKVIVNGESYMVRVEYEEGVYTISSTQIDKSVLVASQGKTFDEAMANFYEAFTLYLEDENNVLPDG